MSWKEKYESYSNMLNQLEERKEGKTRIIGPLVLLCMGIWVVWLFIQVENGFEVTQTFSLICGIIEVILSIIIFICANEVIKINLRQVDNYLERSHMLLAFMEDPFEEMLQADEWRAERGNFYALKLVAIANIIIVCGIAYHIWNATRPF